MGGSPRRHVRWLIWLLLQFTVPAAAQSWRQAGPQGGDVQSLAAVPGVDPRPDHTLYATSYTLSSRGGGGVYRSADGNWRARKAGGQLLAVPATEGVFAVELNPGAAASVGGAEAATSPQSRVK